MADPNRNFILAGFFDCPRPLLLPMFEVVNFKVKPIGNRKTAVLKGWSDFHKAFSSVFPDLLGNSAHWWTRNARGKNSVSLYF